MNDRAVLQLIIRHGRATPADLWALIEQSGSLPLADVARARGLVSDEVLALLGATVVLSDPAGEGGQERRLGKFLLQERLGAGGMGEVWKALQADLHRTVALKLLTRMSESDVLRFRREAQLAASLHHPHIASVYETGDIDGRPYLALQYIAGQTLAELRPPLRRALELVRDAAEAVHHAHLQGIVHRDLKPQNLMVDADGRLYVLDFGLARPVHPTGETVTLSGELLGTPSYMAPEQARGLRPLIGPRTDIWALGVVLYELLTGSLPFAGRDMSDLLARITSADPVPPRRLVSRIDRDVETIVLRCLEKEPARRYAGAGELAADLDRVLRGDSILARRPGLVRRTGRRLARHPGLVGVAGLLALTAMVAVAYRSMGGEEPATLLRRRLREALQASDHQRAAVLYEQLAAEAPAEPGLGRQEREAREVAERAERRQDADSLVGLGEQAAKRQLRDQAIALHGMAVGRDPAHRAAREALARLLPAGPAAHALRGPPSGRARLDPVLEPAGARVEVFPETERLPFVKPGPLAVRATLAGHVPTWFGVELVAESSVQPRVCLPAGAARQGFLFLSDGEGGGVFLALARGGESITWDEARERARAAGGRPPTPFEISAAAILWRRAAPGGESPGNEWCGLRPEIPRNFLTQSEPARQGDRLPYRLAIPWKPR